MLHFRASQRNTQFQQSTDQCPLTSIVGEEKMLLKLAKWNAVLFKCMQLSQHCAWTFNSGERSIRSEGILQMKGSANCNFARPFFVLKLKQEQQKPMLLTPIKDYMFNPLPCSHTLSYWNWTFVCNTHGDGVITPKVFKFFIRIWNISGIAYDIWQNQAGSSTCPSQNNLMILASVESSNITLSLRSLLCMFSTKDSAGVQKKDI